jgi:hypothetical protein
MKKGKGQKKDKHLETTAMDNTQTPSLWSKGAKVLISLLFLVLPFLPWHPIVFLPPLLCVPVYVLAACFLVCQTFAVHILQKKPVALIFEGLSIALILFSYFTLKSIGIHPSGTDENIYFYMAKRFCEGALPYKDFFFAHPPMHLVLPALLFKVFGFNLVLAKCIPPLCQAIAGLFLYLAVRRAHVVLALLALLFHLTAYQTLMGSTDMNGENILTMFLMIAFYFAMHGKPLITGIFCGIALTTALYGFALVFSLFLAFLFASRAYVKRFLLGLLGATLLVTLPFLIIGGQNFLDGVLLYHLAKPVKGSQKMPIFLSPNPLNMFQTLIHNTREWFFSEEFKKSLYFHAPLYLSALLGLVYVSQRALSSWFLSGSNSDKALEDPKMILTPRDLLSGSMSGLVKFSILAIFLFNIQLSALNEVYDFYLVPMMPFLGVCLAFWLFLIYDSAKKASSLVQVWKPLAFLVLFGLHYPITSRLNRSLWPEETKEKGQEVQYDFRPVVAFQGLANLAKSLFFEDKRKKGEVTPYYLHYLWNKRLQFSKVEAIGEYIRENSQEDETITGASTLAPLVAIFAERRMSADEADTNAKRFKSGMLREKTFFETVCNDRVKFVVSAPRSYFTENFMEENQFAKANFVKDRQFVDPYLQHFSPFAITLYKRTVDTKEPCKIE